MNEARKEVQIPDFLLREPPCTVGEAVGELEKLGVDPREQIRFVLDRAHYSRHEVMDQSPPPGQWFFPHTDVVVLTLNIRAVPAETVQDLLQQIARELQFQTTRIRAAERLRVLLLELSNRVDAKTWHDRYATWALLLTEDGKGLPSLHALLVGGGTDALVERLPEEPEELARELEKAHFADQLAALLSDRDFAEQFLVPGLDEIRDHIALDFSRFHFFASERTQEAEARLSPRHHEVMNQLKSKLIHLYARLDQYRKVDHTDLVCDFLEQQLEAGGLHYTRDEISGLFSEHQIALLYTDLQARAWRVFTAESYRTYFARYLSNAPDPLHTKWQGGELWVNYDPEDQEADKERIEILEFLFVPVTVSVRHGQDDSPYLILGKDGKDRLGQVLVA